MRRILAFFLLLLPALSLVKYKDKVWWEKPAFNVTPVDAGPFMIFKTPLKPEKVRFVAGKILLYDRDKDTISLYSPGFKEIYSVKNIKEKLRGLLGTCQGMYGCRLDIFVPSPDGKKVAVGYANTDKLIYPVGIIDLASGNIKKLAVLDKANYPGMDPIAKIKRDPSILHDFPYTLIHQFSSYHWVGDKLYLWYRPESGLHFGGLVIIDVKTGKVSRPFEKFDRLIGVNKDFLVYTLFRDEDAMEVVGKIFVQGRKGKFSIDGTDLEAVLGGHFLIYRKNDHKTWVLYNLKARKALASLTAPRDLRVLSLTPSGKRAFFVGKLRDKTSLYLYDFRDGKFYDLFPREKDEHFSSVRPCYDGEFLLFIHRGELWAGYLTDLTPPLVSLSITPLFRGEAFLSPVKIKFDARDRCFTSGLTGEFFFNGKKMNLGEEIKVELKEGKNTLVFSVKDRAGNERKIEKVIVYRKPPKVNLMEISRDVNRYSGKLVLIEGYAWGWMSKAPEEARKLSQAPGNTARSRNWGSIEDGTAVAFFPVAPKKSGKVRAYVVVKEKGKNWILEPVHVEFIH